MNFTIIGTIRDVETIAVGSRIRELKLLEQRHGKGRCRKRKGIAVVRLADDTIAEVEVHWYEADGIGRRDMRIKRRLT